MVLHSNIFMVSKLKSTVIFQLGPQKELHFGLISIQIKKLMMVLDFYIFKVAQLESVVGFSLGPLIRALE